MPDSQNPVPTDLNPTEQILAAHTWRKRVAPRAHRFFHTHCIAVIRTGETAVALALWLGGISFGGDLMIAVPLFIAGWIVSVIGILTAENVSKKHKMLFAGLVSVFFLGSALVAHAHLAIDAQPVKSEIAINGLAFRQQKTGAWSADVVMKNESDTLAKEPFEGYSWVLSDKEPDSEEIENLKNSAAAFVDTGTIPQNTFHPRSTLFNTLSEMRLTEYDLVL